MVDRHVSNFDRASGNIKIFGRKGGGEEEEEEEEAVTVPGLDNRVHLKFSPYKSYVCSTLLQKSL
jgi:hypothetical protein